MRDALFKSYIDSYRKNNSDTNDKALASYLKTKRLTIRFPELIEGLNLIEKPGKYTAIETYSIFLSRFNISDFNSYQDCQAWIYLMFILCRYHFENDDSKLEHIKTYQKSLYILDFIKPEFEAHIIQTVYPELFSEYQHYLLFGQIPWHIFYAKI